jgi:hypothetical protein
MSFNGLLLLVDLQNESNIFGSLASQYFYFNLLGTSAGSGSRRAELTHKNRKKGPSSPGVRPFISLKIGKKGRNFMF